MTKMPRPETIIRRSLKKVPLSRRVRRKCQRMWSEARLAARKARYRRQVGGWDTKQVAFVFGCQRSGTNMVLRTLAASMEVDRVEESDPAGFCDCRIRDQAVRDALVARSTAKCVIFKPICDSHRALELYAEDPGSRGIWIYRRYQDVANSAVEYWGDQTQRFLEDLLKGDGNWGVAQWNREKVTPECVAELRQAAADGLSPHAAAALFWYMRNRTYFEQKLDAHPATLLVRYEDVVTDPAGEFERLCRFLNINFGEEMAAKVFSSSVKKRPFPPVGAKVEALCEGMLARLDAVRASAR